MKSIEDADISSQTRVLVRGDLDVPLEDGNIKDAFRLDHMLPSLNLIKEKGGKSIICGHLGRPGGKYVEELSSKHLKPYFGEKLGEESYELLENLRFNSGERSNSEGFAKELASKADIYVNEGFSTSHREHTSYVGVPKLLPSFAGLNLQKEVLNLNKIIRNPESPLVAVIGGVKVETKRPIISKFLKIAEKVLVGGKIGLDWGEDTPDNLLFPIDYTQDNKDIGKKTIVLFEKEISRAKTIIWSGPMGVFEDDQFVEGTKRVGEAIVASGAFSVAGGGDTIAALNKFDLFESMSFVSTGGGAMLEFLVKGNLPGLKVLGYNG